DSKWLKIQVDGVRTGVLDATPEVYSPETLDTELRTMNPIYAKLKIVQPPRWMRTKEDLTTTPYSSIIFAAEDEEQARRLLREVKSLAVFGRNCYLRHYADRPPVIQCKKCWDFGHVSTACKRPKQTCRLCGDDHTETEHREKCEPCKDAMYTGSTLCTHNMCCRHCKGQ
ncbi:hypothetical protein B0H19DRAFT_878122, partial [Mycena capillaripes]